MARVIIVGMLVLAAIAGALLYYNQVYAFYEEVQAEVADVRLTSLVTGEAEPILFENFQAIDSDSSPIRYRACFTTPLSEAMLTETFIIRDDAEPLVAPPWFDCFDAARIGADIASGEAIPFLGVENITYGIDRLVAIYPDGRAYAWHQINECGEIVFNREPVPDDCPPAPESLQ
ncbi:DUF6446 family protein [Cognatiyoonia sp. IB215182]|uniref:DUF6446 family protein n=1 Tax=Cognatiyoonia sp. IB215182 TaxID=3097353 RepID=UPI002A151DE0|nr:DUF6446 family protein [Cognatiyoonia sp. IB215182]MDX8351354.1 DUF6446 family protein [Cognatiyoonia sp. IB215182]